MTRRKVTDEELGLRPLTARSVLLSTLLGLDPPALPAANLVATTGLFGISEGAARTALSRMAAAGEVVAEGGSYRLAGRLLDRQRRQRLGLAPPPAAAWSGGWHVAVVAPGPRPAAERAALRAALAGAHLAEWREGVWLRPDNLPRPEVGGPLAWLAATPDDDPAALAGELWDLAGRARLAAALGDRLARLRPALDAGDTGALGPGFVLSAAVLRHLSADPLLPPELDPPGDLRHAYRGWDTAYRTLLDEWHRRRGKK
jgi:phenylacetic acid degradation operon negative regulatory protein